MSKSISSPAPSWSEPVVGKPVSKTSSSNVSNSALIISASAGGAESIAIGLESWSSCAEPEMHGN